MAKTKTTRRFLANNYNCKTVGYCDLWHLFRNFDGITYYTSGVYGWNFDAFCYGNKCLTTGYRGMIGDRVNSDIISKYENRAKEILNDCNTSYQDKKPVLDQLIEDFFNEAFWVNKIQILYGFSKGFFRKKKPYSISEKRYFSSFSA